MSEQSVASADVVEAKPEVHPPAKWRSRLAWTYSPAIVFVLSAVLIAIAWGLTRFVLNQGVAIAIFTAAALVAYHVTAYLTRKLSDEQTYKITDYFYLCIGLVGLAAVLDIQTDFANSRLSVAGKYYAILERFRCENPNSQRCAYYRKQQKAMDEIGADHLKVYEAWTVGFDQRSALMGQNDSPERDVIRQDLNRFEDEYKYLMRLQSYVSQRGPSDKLLAIYLIAIGAAIRLTKVTAEIFKWFRSNPAEPSAGTTDTVATV